MSVSSLQYINKNTKTIGMSYMRINELLTEETLDELSLAQVGKGIGNVARGVGKAVGGVQGAWQGAKQQFSQGKHQAQTAARNVVGGGSSTSNPPQTPAQQQSQDATVNVSGQTVSGNTAGQTTPATNQTQQTPTTGAPAKKSATDIADTIKSIYSDQSNPIGAPGVKQEIIALAKAAGMQGMKIESVGYSRFLGMEL